MRYSSDPIQVYKNIFEITDDLISAESQLQSVQVAISAIQLSKVYDREYVWEFVTQGLLCRMRSRKPIERNIINQEQGELNA